MPFKHDEISRFTESGKTFFFNRGRASNDTEYLSVNALYGKGNQQRMVIFPAQMMSFYKHLLQSIKEITGLVPAEQVLKDPNALPPWPKDCPTCGNHELELDINMPEWREWAVVCPECQKTILKSEGYDEN